MIPKFRAWDKEHDEMLYPDDVDKIYFEITVDGIVTYDMRYILPYDDIPPYLDTVIMQSTGLTDKNGKEIYEGDIIGREDRTKYDWYVSLHQVVKKDCGLMGKQLCSHGSYIGLDYWTSGKRPYVVLGNVHENPELLK